jgi:Zn-dependent peptidase ImmA (M78 family)
MESSIQKGDAFEDEIYAYFRRLIDAGEFWAKSENCKLNKKPRYYSKDRESGIQFDLSIEIFLPGSSEYSSLVIIECKDYSSPVGVQDVEEFFTKIQQVAPANGKAILVSSNAFQRGARTFAKSKKIGLLRRFSKIDLKWDLYRSASSCEVEWSLDADRALDDPDYKSKIFDMFMESDRGGTVSLWRFFDDIFFGDHLVQRKRDSICNNRSALDPRVPYLSREYIEKAAADLLGRINYRSGEVALNMLSATIDGLVVRRNGVSIGDDRPLGWIDFTLMEITLFESDNFARDRFTFAHELSHVFLGHGKYVRFDSCDEKDFDGESIRADIPEDIKRMEIQANSLAASLLMPRADFISSFLSAVRLYEVPIKRYGALYLDDQPCNMQSYLLVVRRLMAVYSVSKTAVHIRLNSLGLLSDQRAISR